jgi:hypothetical protein
MKRTIMVLGVTLLLSVGAFVTAQTKKSADEAAIRQVVQLYFDGWHNNDAESIMKAFHSKARVFSYSTQNCPGNTDLSSVTGEEFSENFKHIGRRSEPKPFTPKVVSVDIPGDMAVVKAELYWPDAWWGCGKISPLNPPPGVTDTNYLTLVRFVAGWKIVGLVSSTREGK